MTINWLGTNYKVISVTFVHHSVAVVWMDDAMGPRLVNFDTVEEFKRHVTF